MREWLHADWPFDFAQWTVKVKVSRSALPRTRVFFVISAAAEMTRKGQKGHQRGA